MVKNLDYYMRLKYKVKLILEYDGRIEYWNCRTNKCNKVKGE